LTNACNSVNVFASIAFITIDDVGTFLSLSVGMSTLSPCWFRVITKRAPDGDSNIRAFRTP
jgi:hypothetical protein